MFQVILIFIDLSSFDFLSNEYNIWFGQFKSVPPIFEVGNNTFILMWRGMEKKATNKRMNEQANDYN